MALVNKNGIVTAKAEGESTITAACSGMIAKCDVTVEEVPVKSTSQGTVSGKSITSKYIYKFANGIDVF